MSINPGAVQVAPDSTGKKIRTIEATVLQPDGTEATVEMQVVALADELGQPINVTPLADLLEQVIERLDRVIFQLELSNG